VAQMTQDDIARNVAANLADQDVEAIQEIINVFLKHVHVIASMGYEVELEGLGTFSTKTSARKRWDFKLQDKVVGEYRRIVFKIADNLKPRMAGNERRDRED
jgi:nucleoid DNA-binding protein